MSNKLLLPNKFKKVGWCILIPTVIVHIILRITEYEPLWLNTNAFAIIYKEFLGKETYLCSLIETNITSTLIGILVIVGAMFVAFSKEKREDEFIAKLRLSSLLWAVWINYILLLLAFIFIYGSPFLLVMVYNMFTILVIFIIRFNYILYKNSKTVSDEK